MEYETRIKLGSQVSIVICPIDDYTGNFDASPDIGVFLKGVHAVPVRKHEGYFVFCNMEREKYDISLVSEYFFNETREVYADTLDAKEKTVYVSLKPRPNYPFSRGATLIRFSAVDSYNKPLGNVSVRAVVLSEGCARAKLGKNGIKSGSDEMTVTGLSGKICVGDEFAIKGSDADKAEFCRILNNGSGSRTLKLDGPVSFDHMRGETLMPVITTRTDERGEGIVYFRNYSMKVFSILLEIMQNDRKSIRELTVEEGKTCNLGKIMIDQA